MKLLITITSALILIANTHSQNLLNGPDDIVFDEKYNRYLIGNWAGNMIVALDSNGNQTVFKTNIPYCHGMELFGDTLYTASAGQILGININNAAIIKSITIPGSARLGHVTLDTINNILYVSDWYVKKIYKLNLNTGTPGVLVNSGIEIPAGILFDGNNDRIILLIFDVNTPVKAVDPSSGQVTNITSTGYDNLDAIIRDKYGYIYASSFTQGIIYRFDSTFSVQPVVISMGHNGPSGFGYNSRDHILGVTNYNSNSYSLINLPVISVKNISGIVNKFMLFQNYPNPFNSSTSINFYIPEVSNVKLVVYDISGGEIAVLVEDKLYPGTYKISWDADNFASGIYFYKLIANNKLSTKKMCLTK
jgi:hypothetical protein